MMQVDFKTKFEVDEEQYGFLDNEEIMATVEMLLKMTISEVIPAFLGGLNADKGKTIIDKIVEERRIKRNDKQHRDLHSRI